MKIEIGPGEDPQRGYDTFVEIRGDLRDMLSKKGRYHQLNFAEVGLKPFQDNVAERILSIHMLEHLGQDRQDFFFENCYRVLRPGGVLEVHVPNLDAISMAYQAWKKKEEIQHLMDGLQVIMFGAGDGEFAKHRIAYNIHTISRAFMRNGFKAVVDKTTKKSDRHTKGWAWAQNQVSGILGVPCPPFSLIAEGVK